MLAKLIKRINGHVTTAKDEGVVTFHVMTPSGSEGVLPQHLSPTKEPLKCPDPSLPFGLCFSVQPMRTVRPVPESKRGKRISSLPEPSGVPIATHETTAALLGGEREGVLEVLSQAGSKWDSEDVSRLIELGARPDVRPLRIFERVGHREVLCRVANPVRGCDSEIFLPASVLFHLYPERMAPLR